MEWWQIALIALLFLATIPIGVLAASLFYYLTLRLVYKRKVAFFSILSLLFTKTPKASPVVEYRAVKEPVVEEPTIKPLVEEQVVEEEVAWHEIKVLALLNLCDLLLRELRISGDREILIEIQQHVHRLQEIAKTQYSHRVLAETYVLQAKLALIDLEVSRARQLLNQAQISFLQVVLYQSEYHLLFQGILMVLNMSFHHRQRQMESPCF